MKENSPYIDGERTLLQIPVHIGHHSFTKEIKQTTFTKVVDIIEAGYTLGPIVTINNDFLTKNKLLYFTLIKQDSYCPKQPLLLESPLSSFADIIECGPLHLSRDILPEMH